MRIAIYGNLTYDQIIIPDELNTAYSNKIAQEYSRAGGIANFCRAIWAVEHQRSHNREYPSPLEDHTLTAIGQVADDQAGRAILSEFFLMGVDNKQIERYSGDDWVPTSSAVCICTQNNRKCYVRSGACEIRENWQLIDADWHHFMYLDRLKIDIRKLNGVGIISADVCDGGLPQVQEQLPYLDYVFASGDEDTELLMPRIGAFLHGPNCHIYRPRDYVKDKSMQQKYRFDTEAGLNVLGAGDYLSAYAVLELFRTRRPDLERIHQQTLTLLRRQTCEPTSFCH